MHNLRDFGEGKHKNVDDAPYGGGAGMVLSVVPFVKTLEKINQETEKKISSSKVLMASADGKVYNQALALEYTKLEHIVLLCGHYKGIDERIVSHVDEKVSIGDYVLSGGELPAMVIVDSIARLLPDVVSDYESIATDSHYQGLLGAPSYTRPLEFQGEKVPEVLLSGNHRLIDEFRFVESVKKTISVRPDLMEKYSFSKEEKKILRKYGLDRI